MAIVRRDGRVVNPALTRDTATYYAHWTGFTSGLFAEFAIQLIKDGVVTQSVSGPSGVIGSGLPENGDWSSVATTTPDTVQGWRARAFLGGVFVGSVAETFKSLANPVTFGSLTAGTITQTSIEVSMQWFPNTVESTATAYLQYKKASESTWTTFATTQGPASGSSVQTFNATVTGLAINTAYQFRLLVSRTTVNDASATSNILEATTSVGVPSVTTDPATNVTAGGAVLNGTFQLNSGVGCQVYFLWDTVSPPVANQTVAQSISASGGFQASISGLSSSSTYYFQAVTTFTSPPGSPISGSIVSFATPTDPAAEAGEEEHVDRVEFDRKYGVLTTVPLAVRSPASSSSDRLLTTASPFATGDVKISKDGGAFANTANLPTQVTASEPGRVLQLEATELECMEAHIIIKDQDGPAFRDLEILVRTELRLGAVDIDAAANSNKTAFRAVGQGTGHGMQAQGGASGLDFDATVSGAILRSGTAQGGGAAYIDLDASANATDDYYNNAVILIVSGTGAGQSRVILDYTGSNKRATVDASWSVNPNSSSEFVVIPGDRVWQQYRSELSAIPADSGTYGDKFQFIYQRFAFKIDQTATVQTLYKADNSTTLGSRSVSDSGGTQVVGKVS